MSTYFLTHFRVEGNRSPTDAVARVLSALRVHAVGHPDARLQYCERCPWVRVEHLGFYSLKQKARVEMVAGLAQELRSEVVMLAAQTTASCAAYAHYVSGTLQRFLSAGDDQWFEIYGEPEPWESDLLSKEFLYYRRKRSVP